MNRKAVSIGVSLVAVLVVAGLFIWYSPTNVADIERAKDYETFVTKLLDSGASALPLGEISQPFFSTEGRIVEVNGESVQIFEYADSGTANSEAATVSSDGRTIGTTIPTWVSDPHFFKNDKIIVVYVGDNDDVITILKGVVGPQFAGTVTKTVIDPVDEPDDSSTGNGSGNQQEKHGHENPKYDEDTSVGYLEGQVDIGPVCPVVGPGIPCEVSPETYTSREVVAYSEGETPGGPGVELLTSGPVFRQHLSEDGSYRIELPVGIYLINHGLLGVDSSSDLPVEVVIRIDETVTLNFSIDTGIR